ncbi:MAG: SUMF1/EgtB/PvdO family nonheme iron enzyme [Planctomycetota bacterium]
MAGAEELFLEFLERREGGEAVDVDALCREHPEHASELRRLHENWAKVSGLIDRFFESPSLAERLRRQHGEGVDPVVVLEDEGPDESQQAPSATGDAVLGQLIARGPAAGRYRLKGRIAQGGMGVVLRVWDADLRRQLAMKVMHGTASDSGTPRESRATANRVTRFLEEAQITGQLDHPGVVPVHEVGVDARGRVYFTMRLVRGRTLKEIFTLVREHREGWNETRALGVILRACEAVAYAHSKGVIHRDIKPANIMVGKFGETYVMDWGLAKIVGRPDLHDVRPQTDGTLVVRTLRSESEQSAHESPLYTIDGDVLGTPAYMSPEQARGDLEQVSPHSDVYSMGAVLYHLLADQMPYVPPGTQMSSRVLLSRVIDGPPTPLHVINSRVPAELVAICEKAMSREPAHRYADMIEMAEDLRAYLEHRVVRAYRTGALAEFQKWVARNRGMAAGVGIALLTAIVFLAVYAYVMGRKNEALDRTNEELARARDLAQTNERQAIANAQEAVAQKKLADAQRDEILQLADLKRLADLEAEADTLWPPWPENLEHLRDWLERAGRLAHHLDLHKATLWRMRLASLEYHRRAAQQPPGAATEGTVPAGIAAEVERLVQAFEERSDLARELAATKDEEERAFLEDQWTALHAAVAAEKTLENAVPWRFATTEEEWQHDTLSTLVDSLGCFVATDAADVTMEHVTLGGMTARVATMLAVQQRAQEAAGAWESCIDALADAEICPEYGGLRITPQTGLVPIGRDPESGLFEFAELISGEPPVRGPGGRLSMTAETGLVFVLLPGGQFWMGAQRNRPDLPNYDPQEDTQNDEWPVHLVTLDPFFIAKYEMTQGQWMRVTGVNPSFNAPGQRFGTRDVTLMNPVESVTWDEAAHVLRHLGLELPTEAQWEYAVRAGTTTVWWTGNEKESLRGAANIADLYCKRYGRSDWTFEEWLDDGHVTHAPVGSFRANPFGLHDVIGNVWEWCRDDIESYTVPPRSGDGLRASPEGARLRVYRGGGFGYTAFYARSANRSHLPPSDKSGDTGVRPIRPLLP